MVAQMRDVDFTWEVPSGWTVELDGKQLHRLNNKEMKASGQRVAYIIEGLGLMLNWLDGQSGPINHIEDMQIRRLRAFVKGSTPFPCASKPGCTPTVLARMAGFAAYFRAKREEKIKYETVKQAVRQRFQEAKDARHQAQKDASYAKCKAEQEAREDGGIFDAPFSTRPGHRRHRPPPQSARPPPYPTTPPAARPSILPGAAAAAIAHAEQRGAADAA